MHLAKQATAPQWAEHSKAVYAAAGTGATAPISGLLTAATCALQQYIQCVQALSIIIRDFELSLQ